MSESPRRKARELVLQSLYAGSMSETDPLQIFADLSAESGLSERNLEFARAFFLLVIREAKWADDEISRLATNWELHRIALMDRTILRMALVELKEIADSPVKVVLNEAIELAKRFSTAESASFINGILDAHLKRPPAPTSAPPPTLPSS